MRLLACFSAFLLLASVSVAATEPKKPEPEVKPEAKVENKQDKKQDPKLDWGDWDQKFKPHTRYGVGIKGKLQNAISELDKSDLINNSDGVETSKKTKTKGKTLDIKKMKAELKALEKKVEQEIDDDIDY